jgi:protein XagA
MNTCKISLIIILASLIFTPLLFAKEYDLSAQELLVKAAPEKEKAMLLAMEDLDKKSKAEAEAIISKEKEMRLASKEPASAEPKEISQEETSLAPPIGKGAWTLKKEETYIELFYKFYWDNSQWNNARERERWGFDGKYKEMMAQLKIEYGLTNTDTLLLYTMAKQARWRDDFASSTKKGFTQIEPGIKHLLFTDPFICALQLKEKIPLRYSEEAVPALGKHQIDTELKILTAQPWPKLPGYTKFETGFRFRAEEPSDEIPYYFEFGYSLKPNLIIKTSLDGQTAVGGGSHEDWLKATIGPIFKIGNLFNIEFGYGNTFAGRNTSAAQEIFSSLSHQW